MHLIQISCTAPLIAAFFIGGARCARLASHQASRLSHPFAEDEHQMRAAAGEGHTAESARAPPHNLSNMDPEDAIKRHDLYDPHLEPQDADGELEDPSMLPTGGIGYELEKRDQDKEDDEVVAPHAHNAKDKKPLKPPSKRAKPRFEQQDEEEENEAEADMEATEEDELQKEEEMDESEEKQHDIEQQMQEAAAREQPPPPKLEPQEARKLLLSYGTKLEDLVNQIISAQAAVPDLLGTKARVAKAQGKAPLLTPVAPRTQGTATKGAFTPSASTAAAPQPAPALPPPGPPAMPM